MTDVFPFGYPLHSVLYLTLYIVTLAVHAFFMSYVLAGSVWLAWAALFPGTNETPRARQLPAVCLRDWMPFVLSAAITAAVAPLLFVQILYRQQFYTANLLLGWRWMIVIPVLIVAFYLLYVLKSKTISGWSAPARVGLGFATAGCFVFVAFCWTSNHLLSLNEARWPDVYQSGTVTASVPVLLCRLLMWIAGTFVTMPVLLGRQLLSHKADSGPRQLARITLGGFTAVAVFGTAYIAQLEPQIRSAVFSVSAFPWIGIGVFGAALQLFGALSQGRSGRFSRSMMLTVTIGNTLLLLAAATLREIIRLAHVDTDKLLTETQTASEISGFGLFLGFAVLNTILIAFCIRIVRRRKV